MTAGCCWLAAAGFCWLLAIGPPTDAFFRLPMAVAGCHLMPLAAANCWRLLVDFDRDPLHAVTHHNPLLTGARCLLHLTARGKVALGMLRRTRAVVERLKSIPHFLNMWSQIRSNHCQRANTGDRRVTYKLPTSQHPMVSISQAFAQTEKCTCHA